MGKKRRSSSKKTHRVSTMIGRNRRYGPPQTVKQARETKKELVDSGLFKSKNIKVEKID